MRAAARFALSLYPAAWRRRYGDEMEALLDEGGVTAAGVVDLLRGAGAAHLRGGPGAGTALLWWGLFALAGLGFYKTTENFGAIGDAHSVLGVAHLVVQVAAGVAGAASLTALWFLWRARGDDEGRARRRGLVPVAALLTVAMTVVAAAVGVYLVALLADAGSAAAEPNGPGGLVSVGLSLALQLGVMAAATALAARGVRRAAASPPPVRGPGACR